MSLEKQTSVELSREELKELEANGQVIPSGDLNNNSTSITNDTSMNKVMDSPLKKNRMAFKTKFFYAFGHVYNDMTVCFTFTIIVFSIFAYYLNFYQLRFPFGSATLCSSSNTALAHLQERSCFSAKLLTLLHHLSLDLHRTSLPEVGHLIDTVAERLGTLLAPSSPQSVSP